MAKDEKKEDAKPEKADAKVAAEPEAKAEKKPAAKKPAAKKPAAKKPAAKKAPAKKKLEADTPAAKDEKAEEPKKKPAAKKAPAKKKEEPKKKPAAKKTAKKKEEAPAEEPKKKPAAKKTPKKKEEAVPEGEVIEAVDEKTATKVTYTVKPLFGKYTFSGVVVHNPGLQRYINIEPVSIPHTGARHANRPFAKQHMNIVERLINGMMRTGHGTGQKAKMYRVVEKAFDIILDRTKDNPIQVYIDALCNSAPKEEVTRLRYGGINVPKAVDVSASRRLDIALRNLCRGAVSSSHKSRKRLPETLADELILASKRDINSYAVGKKEELERIAASAR